MMRSLLILILFFISFTTKAQWFERITTFCTSNCFGGAYPVSDSNELFFTYSDMSNNAPYLYRSDGTHLGTKKMANLPAWGYGYKFLGDKIIFKSGPILIPGPSLMMVSDKTDTGSMQLITPDISGVTDNYDDIAIVNGKAIFSSVHSIAGYVPCVTDGTVANTGLLYENPPYAISNPSNYRVADGKVYFAANSPEPALWVTDGSSQGTRKIKNVVVSRLKPSLLGGEDVPIALAAYNGKIFFTAFDSTHGHELWVTDGTEAGTQLFKDLLPGAASAYPLCYAVAGGKLFFVAGEVIGSDIISRSLWVTDGTSTGTKKISTNFIQRLDLAYKDDFLHVYGDKVYFTLNDLYQGLWRSDGTAQGTMMVNRDITYADYFVNYKGRMYFAAKSYNNDRTVKYCQMWQSDGTTAGTGMLSPPNPVAPCAVNWTIVEHQDALYFAAEYNAGKYDLIKFTSPYLNVENTNQIDADILYPNPATDKVNLQLENNAPAQVRIYTVTGNLVLQQNLTSSNPVISITELPAGFYMVHIRQGETLKLSKLVKI